jgi:hypothetical protein
MDTKLNFSSAYHPQIDVQTQRVNQILEDMLRACTLKDNQSWDKCLPYAEFSYKNSYQESIKMTPFEFLYGRKCRTPLFWNKPGKNQIFGPESNLWTRHSLGSRKTGSDGQREIETSSIKTEKLCRQ